MPEYYENTLRVRSSGFYIKNNALLMIGHRMKNDRVFWAPPGGGVAFGESVYEAGVREFEEETGTKVVPGRMLYINEFLAPPLHAIEFFFEVTDISGTLLRGFDPEDEPGSQVLTELKFMTLEEIQQLPAGSRHAFFDRLQSLLPPVAPLTFFHPFGPPL